MENKPDKHYFDKLYKKSDYKFSFQYYEKILEDIIFHKKSGKVLDLGCGEGGLSLALAKAGFKVSCLDISRKAIDEINEKAAKNKVTMTAICADLESYKINENYDIVILCGILHFFGKGYSKKIKEIKDKTNKHGIHIVDAFVSKYLSEDELIKMYSDWKILEKEIYISKDKEENEMVYLIAEK
jgi:2-polyprenyl-3-methyl-5-hydroxy-6-metoxy-1,4-benzoquinol methylase